MRTRDKQYASEHDPIINILCICLHMEMTEVPHRRYITPIALQFVHQKHQLAV